MIRSSLRRNGFYEFIIREFLAWYNTSRRYYQAPLPGVLLIFVFSGGRTNATHIVVLLTDGRSTSTTLTTQQAQLLKNSVDTVVAIGDKFM